MEANLDQEIDKSTHLANKNWLNNLWQMIRKPFDNLSKLEVIVFFTNTVLLLVMFGAGISTMIKEVTNVFPIHPLLMYPSGFVLMGIVVMATHVVTKLSAELVFNWRVYNVHYKIFLPITNIALIILCWSVQSEGGEIMNTDEIEAKIAAIRADTASVSLKQLDNGINRMQLELSSIEQTITYYDSLKDSRKGKWLRESEVELIMQVQEPKAQLSKQLSELTTARVVEQNRLTTHNDNRIIALKEELKNRIQKGRGKAGLAEGLMVFISFFMMAYKKRYVVYEEEEEAEPDEHNTALEVKEDAPNYEQFPPKMSIDTRERMLAGIMDVEAILNKTVLLIHYKEEGELRYYGLGMKSFMKTISTTRSEYDSAVTQGKKRVYGNKLRNIQFHEQLLSKSPLDLGYLHDEYEYSPMYPDYWRSTIDSTAESTAIELQKSCAVPSSG